MHSKATCLGTVPCSVSVTVAPEQSADAVVVALSRFEPEGFSSARKDIIACLEGKGKEVGEVHAMQAVFCRKTPLPCT